MDAERFRPERGTAPDRRQGSQSQYLVRVETVLRQYGRDGRRIIETATFDPEGDEQAIDERLETLGMAQLHAGDGAHEHQCIDREMRVELQRNAVAFGVAVQVLKHVATLGWDGRR